METEQERWNQKGRDQTAAVAANPSAFQISADRSPMPYRLNEHQLRDLLEAVGDLEDKHVLEVGSGYGRFATYLSKLGARVTAIDVGPDLCAATRALAEANGVTCEVATANAKSLPFRTGSFDVVIGLAVLHHLSEPEAARAIADSHRVLAPHGVAVFYETVEDSPAFDFLQKLLPAGKPSDDDYRPSILQRRRWRTYVDENDEREMTTAELQRAGEPFGSVEVMTYGFLGRLHRLLGPKVRSPLAAVDRWLFAALPPVRRFARFALVVYRR